MRKRGRRHARGRWVVAALAAAASAAGATLVAQSSAAAEGAVYRVDVTADWTMTVRDTTGSLDARSTGRLRYSTRASVGWNASRDTVDVTPSPGTSSRGTYTVRLTGTDARGCSFDYRKELGGPMSFQTTARVTTGLFPMPTKRVRAPYFLEAHIYGLGNPPTLPPTCDSLGTPVADGALFGLAGVFQRVVWFNAPQTILVGTWPELWNYRPFPFGALGYVRLWPSAPRRQGGSYQHPPPVSALTSGKPLSLGASLAGTRQLVGAPSVTVTTTGRINFAFKRAA